MAQPEFSIVVPVYNEAENIEPLLRGIERQVVGNYELLVVYDFDADTTLPAIAAMDPPTPRLRLVKNTVGKGVVNALRAGFAASRAWLGVVVFMADMSDPPERIMALVDLLRRGHDVAAGSRYMPGGQQLGGPWIKGFLSRLAGLIAYYCTGIGSHDVTTNFRAYSRRFLAETKIESQRGFELGLELTVKCHLAGGRVGQAPSSWRDRAAGVSRFRLLQWIPAYLYWYLQLLLGDPFGLSPFVRARRLLRQPDAHYDFFGVHYLPGYGWTARRYLPAIMILPITRDGRFVMIEGKRPCLGDDALHWELPGGAADVGEDAGAAARRELREETGYIAEGPAKVLQPDWEPIPGMGTFPHTVVVLHDCEPGPMPTDAANEGIVQAMAMDKEEVRELMRAGKIVAMPTIAALAMHGWRLDQGED